MKKFSKLVLCAAAAALFSSVSAFANQLPGGGGSWGCTGAVKTIALNMPGYQMNYAIGANYNSCATSLNSIVTAFSANPTLYIVQVYPCVCSGGTTPVEIDPPPMSPERIIGGLHAEQELRDRFNIDSYEVELKKLWETLEGDASDGGH